MSTAARASGRSLQIASGARRPPTGRHPPSHGQTTDTGYWTTTRTTPPPTAALSEWNFPVSGAYLGTQALISGTIYGVSFVAQTDNTVSNICVSVQTQAVTPTTGQNLMALYSVSGTTWTQIGITGDLGVWGSGQFNAFPMGGSVTLVRAPPMRC